VESFIPWNEPFILEAKSFIPWPEPFIPQADFFPDMADFFPTSGIGKIFRGGLELEVCQIRPYGRWVATEKLCFRT